MRDDRRRVADGARHRGEAVNLAIRGEADAIAHLQRASASTPPRRPAAAAAATLTTEPAGSCATMSWFTASVSKV